MRLPEAHAQRQTADGDELDDLQDAIGFLGGAAYQLKEFLPKAEIMSEAEAYYGDAIRLGSRIRVLEEGGRERMWRLVLTAYDLAGPDAGILESVDWSAPMGGALDGRRAGETVTVPGPDGPRVLLIQSVEQPRALWLPELR